MLKKFFISCILLILLFINLYTTVCYAETITLSQIATQFNNCSTIKEIATYGSIWRATSEDNKLTIEGTVENQSYHFEYTLEGTILTGDFAGEKASEGFIMSTLLIDCIGQLHGYAEGDLMATMNAEEVANYTIEKEGLEVKKLAEDHWQMKVDIAKKIPLVEFSDTYIEVSDLEDLKQNIAGDGFAQKSKGNIIFNKNGYGNEVVFFVGEKTELTQNAYKSVLSLLQVMFDSQKVVDYFQENYPNITLGNKAFSGFKIEINPEKSEMEKNVLGEDNTYSFIRITIHKDLVQTAISGNIKEDKPTNNKPNSNVQNKNDKTQATKILPKTGEGIVMILGICVSMIVLMIAILKICYYSDC